jgi:hypothetical protein
MDAQPSSPAVRTSRPSFIDGELEIVRYAQFLATEYPKALRKAIKQAVKEEQSALQEAASNDGDWNQLANSMSVRYNTETADVVYGVTTGKQAMQKAREKLTTMAEVAKKAIDGNTFHSLFARVSYKQLNICVMFVSSFVAVNHGVFFFFIF